MLKFRKICGLDPDLYPQTEMLTRAEVFESQKFDL